MKKRLAKWFLLVAKRLDPETHIENAQVIKDYEARKLCRAFNVTKKDIKNFRFKDGDRKSFREGKRELFKEVQCEIRKSIIAAIDENELIEFSSKKVNEGYCISGELKVYVAKPKKDEEIS